MMRAYENVLRELTDEVLDAVEANDVVKRNVVLARITGALSGAFDIPLPGDSTRAEYNARRLEYRTNLTKRNDGSRHGNHEATAVRGPSGRSDAVKRLGGLPEGSSRLTPRASGADHRNLDRNIDERPLASSSELRTAEEAGRAAAWES